MRAAIVLIIFILGLLVGFRTSNLFLFALMTGISGLFLSLNFMIRRSPANIDLRQFLNLSGVAFLILSAGILDGNLNYFNPDEISDGEQKEIEAIVESRRTLSSSEMYTLVSREISGRQEPCQVILFTSSKEVLNPGEVIRYYSLLEKDSLAPGLQRKFITTCFTPNGIRIIGESYSLKFFFLKLRDKIDSLIASTHLNSETKALLRALLIADRSGIDNRLTQMMRDGGVIHTLAVSGMHIAIIAVILMMVTRPLSILLGRKTRLLLILFGIWVFVLMTGSSFSTVRSAIMISVATAAILLERRRNPFSAVCLSALLIIAIQPYALTDIGFQLSFASVASLSLLADPLNPIDHRRHPITYKIYALILSTLIATAATWLLCGYYFGSFAIRFIPSNLLIIPILPVYIGVSIFYLLLHAIGVEIELLSRVIDTLPQIIGEILDNITIPSMQIEVGPGALILWMTALVSLAIAVNARRKHSIAGELEAASISINFPFLILSFCFAISAILCLYLKI